jgi:hypothetical protein
MDVRAAIDARRESARRNCWSFCIVGRQHFSDKAPVDSDPRRTRNRLVPQDQARNTMAQSRFHKDGDVIRTNKTCVLKLTLMNESRRSTQSRVRS